MKYLVITDDSGKTQESAFVEMEATQRWLEKSRKKGAIEAIYTLAGNHGAVLIVDVDSPEALDELMISMPGACSDTKLQIHALADYGVSMKMLSTHFKRVMASMKSRS